MRAAVPRPSSSPIPIPRPRRRPRPTARYYSPTRAPNPNSWFRLPPGTGTGTGAAPRQPPSFAQLRCSDATLFPTHHPSTPTQPPPPFSPPHLQQPLHYYPHHYTNGLPPPKLSPSIASLHNAALVYLHRGLAIHSIQRAHQGAPSPPALASLDPSQEPFSSAVAKGFNQILLLQTGLEFAQPRQVMESLMAIVRGRLDAAHSSSERDPQEEVWTQSKWVIVHSALRPRMACVGEWAWEEIRRGNFNRLVQVWAGILQVIDQKPNPLLHPTTQHPTTHPHPTTSKTIGLDESFFTALVTVSSTIQHGPKLSHLVQSLVTRVWSRVQPSDQLSLEGIVPDPQRARYFLRAVELGLLWKRPNGSNQPDTPPPAGGGEQGEGEDAADGKEEREEEQEEEEVKGRVEQDERIVHLIRRTFQAQRPEAIQFCVDLSKRIREAVEGYQDEAGWLAVNWAEPTTTKQTSTGEEKSHRTKDRFNNAANTNASQPIALTQRVVSILLNGCAENGLMGEVEELIGFCRQVGGMNQQLWTSILRGLSKSNKKDLINDYLKRMTTEDGIQVDFRIRCILISASINTSDMKGALESIDHLVALCGSEPQTNEKKLPIEAINSILSALLQNKLLHRAENFLQTLSGRIEPNTTTLNHFLKYHSRLNPKTELDLDSALGHLKTFEDVYAVRPDVISFTILLNILMKLGFGATLIEKLLLMMKAMNIQPNAITYGSIIHHLCRSGKSQDVHVALNLLNHIEANGVATTEITYTALIQGFLRAHIQEYEARTHGMHPLTPQDPVASHNSPETSAHEANKTNLERAIELIARLKARASPPSTHATNGMPGLLSSGHGGGGGGKINQVIYNSLLNALFSTGEYETGFQVFKLMKSEYDALCQHQRQRQRQTPHPEDQGYLSVPHSHTTIPPRQHQHQPQIQSQTQRREQLEGSDYYYGNGFVDSYGIVFRRLIQFGQFNWFRIIYQDYFLPERFPVVPPWIQRLIDKFDRSSSF